MRWIEAGAGLFLPNAFYRFGEYNGSATRTLCYKATDSHTQKRNEWAMRSYRRVARQ